MVCKGDRGRMYFSVALSLDTGVGAGAAWLLSRRPTFDQEGNYGGLNTTITSSEFLPKFFASLSFINVYMH